MAALIDDVSNKFFDYIIVGGGTAGLTLAARLSEDPDSSVLVLEAGEANLDDPNILRPASFGSHFSNKSYFWDHLTNKQKYAGDRQNGWQRGRGLGGSSGINFLCWTKPPARDIDDFERLGNSGWNWKNYENCLERTEGFVDPSDKTKTTYNMNSDNWKIGPLSLAFPATMDEAELKIQQTFLNSGLNPAPHPILELSGIGREDILESIGVPMIMDLPGVGENVQEHMFIGLSWELKNDVKFDTLDLLRDPVMAAKHLDLHPTGSGLFTTGIVGFAFTTLDKVTSQAGTIYQYIKEMISDMDPETSPPGLMEQYKIMLERFEPGKGSPGCEFISFPGLLSHPNPPADGKRYVTILAATNHTFSRGTIVSPTVTVCAELVSVPLLIILMEIKHSTSSNPTKDPEFDAHYFEQMVDLDIFTEMCKFARKLADVEPLKDMIVKELNPGAEVQTDEQLRGTHSRMLRILCLGLIGLIRRLDKSHLRYHLAYCKFLLYVTFGERRGC
ncbi:hypothetical protein EW026_g4042 [Hermanssonia centrifuga]|uniref:Glucose-methanol-choline oxidoreductase N-terminal domain-containing protein n=1 Tax=Hermanssonia centrifuga TaxID=98765 RepID=A0A4S4KIF6_9APHY|nr:hypothetical protein EW026_g4042 [Hermanssonia centrifuga]